MGASTLKTLSEAITYHIVVTGFQTYKIRMKQHSAGLVSSNYAHDEVLSVSKFFKQLQTAVK